MKKATYYFSLLILFAFILGCQDSIENEVTQPKQKRNSNRNARRACLNSVVYGFVKPDNDYGYNGNGCVTYYVHRGATRQFKIKMTNAASSAQDVTIDITHPNNTGMIDWGVLSTTGGSLNVTTGHIVWSQANMPANTTYELILTATVPTTASSGENTVLLYVNSPCSQNPSGDCDLDDNLHVVVTN